MTGQGVEVDDAGSIITVALASPPANGLSMQLVARLSATLDDLMRRRTSIAGLIITSRLEGIFIAGADIKMIKTFMEGPDLVERMVEFNTFLQRTINKIGELPFPVLAAINGHAMGGGLELALACDFRFMATGGARAGMPEVNLGLLPGAGGTQRLSRLIGPSRAKDLIFNARALTAEEALVHGIVDRVCAPELLVHESVEYMEGLSRKARRSIALIKHCINQGLDTTMEGGLGFEMEALRELLGTNDAREGVTAFIEKRSPVFRGD